MKPFCTLAAITAILFTLGSIASAGEILDSRNRLTVWLSTPLSC
jgi:hypothetical protein